MILGQILPHFDREVKREIPLPDGLRPVPGFRFPPRQARYGQRRKSIAFGCLIHYRISLAGQF